MRYSGIAVLTRPDDLDGVAALLADLPGLELHGRDAGRGRLVVVYEAASIGAHEACLRAIQELPGVCAAELVSHVEDVEDGHAAPAPAALANAAHLDLAPAATGAEVTP